MSDYYKSLRFFSLLHSSIKYIAFYNRHLCLCTLQKRWQWNGITVNSLPLLPHPNTINTAHQAQEIVSSNSHSNMAVNALDHTSPAVVVTARARLRHGRRDLDVSDARCESDWQDLCSCGGQSGLDLRWLLCSSAVSANSDEKVLPKRLLEVLHSAKETTGITTYRHGLNSDLV